MSPTENKNLPEWRDCSIKIDNKEEMSALEFFVYDNEPAGIDKAKTFRENLSKVITEVFDVSIVTLKQTIENRIAALKDIQQTMDDWNACQIGIDELEHILALIKQESAV